VTPVKYTFDTPFGDEGRKRAEDHRQQLDRAREEGRREGFEEGKAQACRELEARISQQMGQLLQACEALASETAALQKREERRAARIAHAIASRLAPALMAQRPLSEVEALVSDCLDGCRRESRIVVRVGDEMVEPLKERLEAIKARSSFTGQIVLLGEPEMIDGDCRVEWPDGGAERDISAVEARIAEAVERFVGDDMGADMTAEPSAELRQGATAVIS